jgi:predicted GH43/DUF377 family glycosyl hydrolase
MKRALLFVILAAVVLLVPVAVVISAPQVAWVKYVNNPVFRPSTDGSWDNSSVYAAKVVFSGGSYHMWYTGNGQTNATPRIGYASSSDGVNWVRHPSPVLLTGAGWESKGVSAPSVLYKDGVWHMWYAGKNLSRYSIGYATSTDGVTWTKYAQNPVLAGADIENAPDSTDVVSPHVLFKDGLFHMWYAARGDNNQIFYATSSNGVQWTKHPNNPVLRLGGDYDWDNGEIAAPAVIWTGAQFEMWYQGYSRGTLRHYIGHATSTDGFTWTKDALNPVVGLEAGKWDSFSVYYPSVLYGAGGMLMMWYQGEIDENQQKQIGLVLLDGNAVPTPLPTFPTESPVDLTSTPGATETPSGPPTVTPTPTATPTPIDCSGEDGKHCILLPAIRR